ncbi:MAG: ParB/RepB/Spo0J family partition protein [Acidimicrobiales bacterium]
MSRRSGLGRGLGSLIPVASTAAGDAVLRDLPLAQIRPNQNQPRKHFDEAALATLVDSVKVVGVLQPVLVRQVEDATFELIAGERRVRAARRAGLSTIPALVHVADEAASLEEALVENLHREDLNPLEEAAAYQQLIEDFDLTHEEVARKVGKSRATVTNALRLFQLPPAVQRHVREGRLTGGHARALLSTPDRGLQESLAEEVLMAGLSVRALEDVIRRQSKLDDDIGGLESGDDTAAPDLVPPPAPTTLASGAPTTGQSGPRPRGKAPDGAATTRLRPPGVLDLEELLGDHLNTRVSVEMGAKRGRVVIEFATLDDLERIYRAIVGGAGSS